MIPSLFDKTKHLYHNDQFIELVKDAVRFFNGTPVHPLPPPERFLGTGVYALYYVGNNPFYKQYNELNAGYLQKHRDAQKEKIGEDEYKKKQNEYMRQYRAQKKQEKQMETNKTDDIIKIQNAIRNKNAIDKFSTLYVEKQKQTQANELAAQMVQQNELKDEFSIKHAVLQDLADKN